MYRYIIYIYVRIYNRCKWHLAMGPGTKHVRWFWRVLDHAFSQAKMINQYLIARSPSAEKCQLYLTWHPLGFWILEWCWFQLEGAMKYKLLQARKYSNTYVCCWKPNLLCTWVAALCVWVSWEKQYISRKQNSQSILVWVACWILLDFFHRRLLIIPPQPAKAQSAAYTGLVPQRPVLLTLMARNAGRPWTTSPLALSKRTANLLLAFGIPLVVLLISILCFVEQK